MASGSIEAAGHRARHARAAAYVRVALRPRLIQENRSDWLHGHEVTNRHERRVALAEAKKYGCDPRKLEHSEKCPKYEAPAEKQEPESEKVSA